jgi:AmiR/NasT family two-component response regulator
MACACVSGRVREVSHSLELLARLAVRETGADGYALEESGDAFVPASAAFSSGAVSFLLRAEGEGSLRSQGRLSFVFRGKPVPEEARAILKRFAALMEAVLRRQAATKEYARRAARIGEMEAELVDAKIAARASGLLADGAGTRDFIGTIESHVEGVLRPSQFEAILGQMVKDLEEEIAERKLTAQAKAVLQSADGMSEEQAHLHLRTISRKSRRPLKEVARELIEARNPV